MPQIVHSLDVSCINSLTWDLSRISLGSHNITNDNNPYWKKDTKIIDSVKGITIKYNISE